MFKVAMVLDSPKCIEVIGYLEDSEHVATVNRWWDEELMPTDEKLEASRAREKGSAPE
jgi:hypothetical protein